MEQNYCVHRKWQAFFQEPLRTHEKLKARQYGISLRNQEEDSAKKNSSASFTPSGSNRQSLLSKNSKHNIHGCQIALIQLKEENFTTRLLPSSSRLVCFRNETISGCTPMMLTTMSTRWGVPKSFFTMAFFRAGQDSIQSRFAVPFSRFTKNSVIAKPSKTLENARSCPLQTTFKQAKIKTWVVNQLLTIPTAQILAESSHNWNNWHIRPLSTSQVTRRRNLLSGVLTVTI